MTPPKINNDPWNFHGTPGGSYTGPTCGPRHQHILDDPVIFNYRGPNVTFNIGTANQFSSKGNFWTGLWNGLTGYNNFGQKTGFGIFDLGFAFLAKGLFGGNKGAGLYNTSSFWKTPSLYSGTPGFDTFDKAHTYVQPGTAAYTPAAKETTPTEEPKELTANEYKKLKDKDEGDLTATEKKQIDAYEKENKLGKYKPKTEPTQVAGDVGNGKGTVKTGGISSADLLAALKKEGAEAIGTHVNFAGIRGTVTLGNETAKYNDKVSEGGYPTIFTVTDTTTNGDGNKYVFQFVGVNNNGKPMYKVLDEKTDNDANDKNVSGGKVLGHSIVDETKGQHYDFHNQNIFTIDSITNGTINMSTTGDEPTSRVIK